jgi:hypothetical protein
MIWDIVNDSPGGTTMDDQRERRENVILLFTKRHYQLYVGDAGSEKREAAQHTCII